MEVSGGEQTVDGGACRSRIAEDVPAVDELVDGARLRQGSDVRVGDAGAQRRGETFRVQDLEWSGVVGPRGGIDRVGQAQLVVCGRDGLIGAGQVVLAGVPVGGGERRREDRG